MTIEAGILPKSNVKATMLRRRCLKLREVQLTLNVSSRFFFVHTAYTGGAVQLIAQQYDWAQLHFLDSEINWSQSQVHFIVARWCTKFIYGTYVKNKFKRPWGPPPLHMTITVLLLGHIGHVSHFCPHLRKSKFSTLLLQLLLAPLLCSSIHLGCLKVKRKLYHGWAYNHSIIWVALDSIAQWGSIDVQIIPSNHPSGWGPDIWTLWLIMLPMYFIVYLVCYKCYISSVDSEYKD